MSQVLEGIVRPVQTDAAVPAPYFAPGQLGVPNVVLKLGRGGGGKTLGGSVSISVSSYCERHENEKTE